MPEPATGLVPANGSQGQSASSAVAAILGIAAPSYIPATSAASLLCSDHPLKDVTDVAEAVVKMQQIAAEEALTKKPKKYPKSILRHQHLVAYLMLNPFATNTDIAQYFGITASTVARLVSSDSFKQCLESHMAGAGQDLFTSIKDKMEATLAVAVDRVQEKIVQGDDPDYALQALDKVANRLGMGVKQQSGAGTQVNVNIITADMIMKARARRLPDAA